MWEVLHPFAKPRMTKIADTNNDNRMSMVFIFIIMSHPKGSNSPTARATLVDDPPNTGEEKIIILTIISLISISTTQPHSVELGARVDAFSLSLTRVRSLRELPLVGEML